MNFHTVISDSPLRAAETCGARIISILNAALEQKDTASLAISGGSTPKLLFQYLAASETDWSRVHLFWVDERAVPPGDPQSNYTLAYENWLQPASYPSANIHRIHAELPISEAASRYSDDIRTHFDLNAGELPAFDIIQQGLGSDAHTASLFPGEEHIADRQGLAAAVYVEKLKAARITLLPGVLSHARQTHMLVTGEDKAEALAAVWKGPEDILQVPGQLLRHHTGDVTWFLDEAAAVGIR